MSNQKGQKQLRAGALKNHKETAVHAQQPKPKGERRAFGWVQFVEWLKKSLPRWLRYLGVALVGVAILLLLVGAIIMATGNASSISRQIDYNLGANADNVPYRNVTGNYNWMWAMIVNYYGYLLPLIYVMAIILPLFILYIVFSILHAIGNQIMRLAYSLSGDDNVSVRLMTTLIIWTVTIVVAWLTINADPVLYLLLACVVMLVINLCLFGADYWLRLRWRQSDSDGNDEANEADEASQPGVMNN